MIKKGIILAGGNGTRLAPLTRVINKHLLPVYDKPMIYYPLNTLISAGIKDILIVCGNDHIGGFMKLLGEGKEFGAHFSYTVQEESGGIAQALSLAEDFAGNENIAVILGDNIFVDNFSKEIQAFEKGAQIFLKEVEDPERFGVAEMEGNQVNVSPDNLALKHRVIRKESIDMRVKSIEEKPQNPKSNLAVSGLYLYDSTVFDKIRTLKPSERGEYEITDVSNSYIAENAMQASVIQNEWTDAGTHESLFRASQIARKSA